MEENSMGKDGPGVAMTLSGYLPGNETNGLDRVADPLYRAFEEARRVGDESRATLRQVVVGVVYVPDAKVHAPGVDKDPVVHLKLEAIEPVLEPDEVEQVVQLLLELRARRRGDAPTLFDEQGNVRPEARSPEDPDRAGGVVPASGGEATGKPPKARRGGLKLAHAAAVEAGDTEAAAALEREQADLEQAEDARAAGVGDPFTVS